jgi:hydrogenase small subunit
MHNGDNPDKEVSGLPEQSVPRRDFLRVCTLAAAAVGLPASAAVKMAEAASQGLKPSVIWLHFQECTGCSESLLRTTHPDIGKLILDLISLDYHETLCAAAGHQVEDALHETMEKNAGKYVCVVEGSTPLADDGIYCKIAGRPAKDIVREVADKAAAVIAIGSCASWGGWQSSSPNPTGATGTQEVLGAGKTVVNLPGCPSNPYNFLGTVLQFVTTGALPVLDGQGRPKHAYGRTIHEHCPRRPHFDAGRFAHQFGDPGHREGYCLYKLGCKGPMTHANCSTLHFGEVNSWPIGIGHPCVGCTEKNIAFRMPIHATATIYRPTPPDTYPPISAERTPISAGTAGVAGLVGGAALGAGVMAARKYATGSKDDEQGQGKEESS